MLSNRVKCWSMLSAKYGKDATHNLEDNIEKILNGIKLNKKASHSWPSNCMAEDDESPELPSQWASYYQHLISILHWIVGLGKVDIIIKVLLIASQMAMPRKGHLDAVLHVIVHLKTRSNAHLVFNPTYPDIDFSLFKEHGWTQFYSDIKEAVPTNAPEP